MTTTTYDNKELFLNQYSNKDTRVVYNRVFKKAETMEEKYGLDLCNFSDDAYEDLMMNKLKPQTKNSARTYCNILNAYVHWAMEEGLSRHTSNPIRRRQEYFYSFVADKKLFFTFKEKESILFTLVNAQDKFLVQALFEGIRGSKMSELIGLEVNDFTIRNDADLVDYEEYGDCFVHLNRERRRGPVNLPISRQTYNLAMSANGERDYYKKNGETTYDHDIQKITKLPNSRYIFKKSNTNSNSDNTISHYSLYNRANMIQQLEEFEEFKESLTTNNIVRSGMIYWAYKLYKRDGKFGLHQAKEVCERFNIVYKWSHKDFLNMEIIEEMYG